MVACASLARDSEQISYEGRERIRERDFREHADRRPIFLIQLIPVEKQSFDALFFENEGSIINWQDHSTRSASIQEPWPSESSSIPSKNSASLRIQNYNSTQSN